MREHSKKYGIDEVEYGVFSKDGSKALGAIGRYIMYLPDALLDYLDELTLDVNGNVEDCKNGIIKGRERNRRYFGKNPCAVIFRD